MKQYTREENAVTLWKKAQPEGDCVVWIGAHDGKGYGMISRGRGHHIRTHRLMWQQAYGPIPTGMYICHHCDNPSCVKLAHLFLGTNRDNQLDCAKKGRRNDNTVRKPRTPEHCAAISEGRRKAKELRQRENV